MWKVGKDGIEAGTSFVPVSMLCLLISLVIIQDCIYPLLSMMISTMSSFCHFKDSIPRPIARISITVIAVTLALFVLKSFLSTAFFVLVCFQGDSYINFSYAPLCGFN